MYLPNFSDTKSSFTWFEFSFLSPRLVALLNLKNPVCPTILCITGEKTDGFIRFPRALAPVETQTASTRNWTQDTYSISSDKRVSLFCWLIFECWIFGRWKVNHGIVGCVSMNVCSYVYIFLRIICLKYIEAAKPNLFLDKTAAHRVNIWPPRPIRSSFGLQNNFLSMI